MIDIKAKIHDKFSIEFKVGFVVRRKTRINDFAINTWFYIPNSLDINSLTYSKKQFYIDVKSNVRLITPRFLLREIMGEEGSPMANLENSFRTMASDPTRTNKREYEYQIKMFMAILKSSMRDEILHIYSNTLKEDTPFLCESYIKNIEEITQKYRSLRTIINAPTVTEKVLNYFFFGDEFMSNIIDQHTYRLTYFIENNYAEHKDIIERLKGLIKSEIKYKNEKGYQVAEEESQRKNQEVIYRQGILKKYIESDLYLKSDQKRDGFFVEQIYYSIAAGVSMIFATAIAFSFQQKFGNFTMPLFAALVVSYMLKDRIKDLMRYYFAHKLGPKFFDNKINMSIKDLPIGWSKEGADFISENKVPTEVDKLRSRSPLVEAENRINDEKILLYRKRVRIDRNKLEKNSKYIISGINDIMRIYINSFTQKMDDPRVPLYKLDEQDNITTIKGNKVYLLNIIMQFQYEGKTDYKRFRVACNRTGILKIEDLSE